MDTPISLCSVNWVVVPALTVFTVKPKFETCPSLSFFFDPPMKNVCLCSDQCWASQQAGWYVFVQSGKNFDVLIFSDITNVTNVNFA